MTINYCDFSAYDYLQSNLHLLSNRYCNSHSYFFTKHPKTHKKCLFIFCFIHFLFVFLLFSSNTITIKCKTDVYKSLMFVNNIFFILISAMVAFAKLPYLTIKLPNGNLAKRMNLSYIESHIKKPLPLIFGKVVLSDVKHRFLF